MLLCLSVYFESVHEKSLTLQLEGHIFTNIWAAQIGFVEKRGIKGHKGHKVGRKGGIGVLEEWEKGEYNQNTVSEIPQEKSNIGKESASDFMPTAD